MSKRLSRFPDPLTADASGVLCYGGDLELETLLDAYAHGIFPWPQEGYPLLWFSPRERGILEFAHLHIPRRLAQARRNADITFTWNQAFLDVIVHCKNISRKGQPGTWITPEIVEGYTHLHRAGFAHSLECWRNNKLIGGLYGIDSVGVFAGESMFGLERDISKFCVLELVRVLKEFGHQWMDIQMVSPVMESLGGEYISNRVFIERLSQEKRKTRRFQPPSNAR